MGNGEKKGFNIGKPPPSADAFINGATAEVLKSGGMRSSRIAGKNVPTRYYLPESLKVAVDIVAASEKTSASAVVVAALKSHPSVRAELERRG